MKSTFRLTFGLLLLSTHVSVQAQTTNKALLVNKPIKKTATPVKKAAPKAAAVTVVSETKVQEPQKSSFDKFYDRLKISYYGAITSPSVDDMLNGQWNNASISPEFGMEPKGDKKNHDTWPTNIWNQLSFNYNFGAKMNFVFNPRFMVPLASSRDMEAPEDRALIALEDFLVGFQGSVITSDDKKFNLWLRLGVRLPTSRASRNSNNDGFGKMSHQLDVSYSPTYDFDKTWQVGISGQFRQWVYEDRYNWSRLRIYTAPYVQYTIDDTTRIQAYYENMLENRRRWKGITSDSKGFDQKPYFEDVWQSVMIGVSKDITPKLNIFPFFTTYINDTPITDKSVFLGAWISYQIK